MALFGFSISRKSAKLADDLMLLAGDWDLVTEAIWAAARQHHARGGDYAAPLKDVVQYIVAKKASETAPKATTEQSEKGED